jgi:outer membrane lipoprotein-sorting protein
MQKQILTIAAVFIFWAGSLSAQTGFKTTENPTVLLEKLAEVSKNTKSIKSDFVQYKHLSILENDIESRGVFIFAKPDKVRWEYSSPYPYLILMNGNEMTIKEGGKVQKFDTESNRIFKEINDLMVALLSGDILNNEEFDITIKENERQILAEMHPKKSELKQMLETVEMYFDKSNYEVSEIRMPEKSGDYTRILFKNRQSNVAVPNSKFLLH